MEIKTKYDLHDAVWFMYGNKPIEGNITGIWFVKSTNVCGWVNKLEYCVQTVLAQQNVLTETDLFTSKEELLASL
jgi:hypothetical protein